MDDGRLDNQDDSFICPFDSTRTPFDTLCG